MSSSPRRLLPFLLAAFAALLAGWSLAEERPAPASPWLMDLHLHGSLSERHGTMTNHVREAEAAGYDGLWWTDHMERTWRSLYVHRVRFEGTLEGEFRPGSLAPNGVFSAAATMPGLMQLEFPATEAVEGAQYLRVDFEASDSSAWDAAFLSYQGLQLLHRVSLLSEPHLRAHFRVLRFDGVVGAGLRVEFSSEPDGATEEGIPYVLEYYVPGSQLPPPASAAVARVPLIGLPIHGWGAVDLDLAADAFAAWPHAPDLGLREVGVVFLGHSGGECEVGLDDFRLELEGPTDLALLRAARDLLRTALGQTLQHEVGMEIAGPEPFEFPTLEEHKHLVALFPGDVPELLYLTQDHPAASDYPATAIDWVQERGGVAILAHPYGTDWPPADVGAAAGRALAEEIVQARAWGADGLEVGYVQRGRPLADHLALWDQLSAAGVYVTGVGVTDNHTVQPWALRPNRMGTWIRSVGSSAPELVAAIRAGDVYFGDPHRVDPSGDFLLDEERGAFRMGDVVTLHGARQHRFRVRVSGAEPGWQPVLLRNGVEVARGAPLTAGSGTWVVALAVAPGDSVRAEMRDAADAGVLFSNPAYFASVGTAVPEHRRPN